MRIFSLLRLRRCSGKIIFQTNNLKRFYHDHTNYKLRNVLKLHERGMFQEVFPDVDVQQIESLLNKEAQCVYAGFDPTADSLHIGNLLVLMNLLHWQRGGHNVIAILGGATGLIGDPSHRTKERIPIDQKTINKNILSIQENIETIFENHQKYFWKLKSESLPLKPLTIVNNIDWYKDINIIPFMRDFGKHFRMGTMLNRASVQSRLKSDTGMSFTEFTYQIFQAYDWLFLLKEYNCRFQIGGSDQLGNISTGHDFISRMMKKNVFGFTLPLITGEGGKKFGKSLGNAVWLSPKKSSSFDLYQYFIRTTDADVENYLKLFTFLPIKSIAQIMKEHNSQPENRHAQQILADNITLLVHGDEGLTTAKQTTLLLYDKSLEALQTMTQEQVTLAFEGAKIVDLVPDGEMTILELAMKAKCFKSESDAARIINAGGFYVNYQRVSDFNEVVVVDKHVLPNHITLLRTGKKTYYVVRWLELRESKDIKVV